MNSWQNISSNLLTLLDQEWEQNQNINAYYFAKFIDLYPVFETLNCSKGESNKQFYVLKKSLIDRFVNKVMTNGHKNTGKKVLAKNLVLDSLIKKSQSYNMSPSDLLIMLLVKTVPNYTIRRLKFGSGHLTRSVRLTILKKISWFLKSFAVVLKPRKIKFYRKFETQIDLIMTNSPRSKLLSLKKEQLSQSEKANIQ